MPYPGSLPHHIESPAGAPSCLSPAGRASGHRDLWRGCREQAGQEQGSLEGQAEDSPGTEGKEAPLFVLSGRCVLAWPPHPWPPATSDPGSPAETLLYVEGRLDSELAARRGCAGRGEGRALAGTRGLSMFFEHNDRILSALLILRK